MITTINLHALWLSLLAAAAATVGCADPPEDDGTGWPGCYDELPDLDGSGAADAGDCALVSVGTTIRTVCEGLADWSALRLCHGVTRAEVSAFDHPVASVLAGPEQTRFTVLMRRAGEGTARLWSDDNDNGHVDAGEVRRPGLAAFQELVVDGTGCVAVTGSDPVTNAITLWHDTDCDLTDQGAERGVVDLVTPGHTILGAPRLGFYGGRPVVVFRERASSQGENIIAWADLDNDRVVDEGERVVIASEATLHGVDSRFTLEVLFSDAAGSYLWRAPNGWHTGRAAATDPVLDHNLRWYRRSQNGNSFAELVVGHRGGAGGGLRINSEVLPYSLAYDAALGVGADAADRGYVSFSSYRSRGIWVDWNRDLRVTQDEVTLAPRLVETSLPALGALLDGSLVFVDFDLRGLGRLDSERWWPRSSTRYLGEDCDAEGNAHCVDGLACRVSGNAPEPRCVPEVQE